jgi:hypothetical protein
LPGVNVKIADFWNVTPYGLQVVTNVSEGTVASIFKVEE